MGMTELELPDYAEFNRNRLEHEVRALREDFGDCLDKILGKHRTNALEVKAAKFFARSYPDVVAGKGIFSICNVQEFTYEVGPLPDALTLDAPPYTELLMQGFRGMAFRHPEYMLARDVEFNYDCFWQTEELVRSHIEVRRQPNWMSIAVENVQTLARSTILSCFSLLESLVSGLGRAHEMTHRELSAAHRKILLNNHGPLLERLLIVPEVISGYPSSLHRDSLPLSQLFGEIKQRRDAFMHCEPGEQESRGGFVKQERFHSVSAQTVDDAVRLTVQVTQTLWRHVHKTTIGPYWLRQLGNKAVYRRGLRIIPIETG